MCAYYSEVDLLCPQAQENMNVACVGLISSITVLLLTTEELEWAVTC